MRALLLFFLLAACMPATTPDRGGSVAVIADIHLDPFAPDGSARLATIGQDTNAALLASALAAAARAAATADLVLVPGDFLAHRFGDKAKGHGPDAEVRTTGQVADALAQAFAGKPVLVALGNEDSDCGDYRVEPNGPYLEATADMVRRLARPGLLAPDFDATWRATGSYAARHPAVANGTILVLNDVLWSSLYQDGCARHGRRDATRAADTLLDWLRGELARARAAGGAVWMVHHIPWGIDAYASNHAKGATCEARVVPLLRASYADALYALLAEYRDTIRASFSGHTHFDDYRLLFDRRGEVIGLDKITPAISPIYGQKPGFQLFAYDRATASPTDFETWHLVDPGAPAAAAEWRLEYRFSEAYGRPYGAASVAALWRSMMQGGPARDTYRRLYRLGDGEPAPAELPAHLCSVGETDVAGFARCWCQ